MFGGHSKLGRGGGAGRGGGKRSLPPPAPPLGLHRPPATGARIPIGASSVPRNRPGGPGAKGAAAAPAAREEDFNLVLGVTDFAAIIRLTPDLVEEIRQVEAQGGAARIKFDSNSNNPSENVIDVGGKEFRFTWSRELGDLCDIYEEHKSGDDGHGLLVECGSTWRKLNVQRILDESTKNHVKMLSEEAERQMKSRKAIVLDPANPSVKNQVKSMAAAGVDGNMRRMSWQQKKEPFFKKRKVESNKGPPKSTFKSGSSANNSTKGTVSVSPQPSPKEQPGPGISVSPFGTGNSSNPEDIIAPLNINREEIGNLEKGMPSNVVHGAMQEIIGHKWGSGNQPMDLRSILITLLSENPKGMTLKALEKAVGEAIPNSTKKIDSIIKNIATFQAPGRYFLKPGVQMGSSKRLASESGSSPENGHDQISAAESVFVEKATSEKYEQQIQLSSKADDPDPFEKIVTKPNDPDPYTGDIKVNNDNEGRACSSSESGSDSDSESDSSDSGSDSGSPSRSRSKSKSPVGSGSASSSDSDSDGSSSSKEGSDVEVEIMTSDDEKEEAEHKNDLAESKLSSLPRAGRASDDEHEQIHYIGKDQEGQVASPPLDLNDFGRGDKMVHSVEVTKNLPINNRVKDPDNHKTKYAESAEVDRIPTDSRFSDKRMLLSPDQYKQAGRERIAHVKKSGGDTDKQVVNNNINGKQTLMKSVHEQSDISERISKSKSKRASSSECFQEKPESAKRPKAASSAQAMPSWKSKDATLSENSHYRSPDTPRHDLYKDQVVQTANKIEWDVNTDINSQCRQDERGRSSASKNAHRIQKNPDFLGASNVDPGQSGPRTGDLNIWRKGTEKSSRHVENFGWANEHSEGLSFRPDGSDTSAIKRMPIQDKVSLLKDKLHKDIPVDKDNISEKYLARNVRESSVGDKLPSNPDSYNIKSVANSGLLKDGRHPSNLCKSVMDNSPAVSGKGSVLRRELSDLELGEFREPHAEEVTGVKGQFERRVSLKPLENKVTATDNANLDINRGRAAENALELKKQSPANLRTGTHGIQDGLNRRASVDDFMDSTRPQQRAIPPQSQQLSRLDHAHIEAMPRLDRSAEMASRNEIKTCQGMSLENHSDAHEKYSVSLLPQHDNRHVGRLGTTAVKESKPQKSSNNSFLVENDEYGVKRRESSWDEDNSFYSKFDKDKPELKGPIKDYSEYKEYVQEYREKYDHYCSLNKNLENTRNDFLKVGNDLEVAKGRDMEEYTVILEQLKEMYHHYGARHKQMKKVFILLHDELKNLKKRILDFAQTYAKE